MEIDDELDHFIREHKARVAEDKASLEQQDRPYMEMRGLQSNIHRAHESAIKENIPPSNRTTLPGKDESFCVGLPLGVDYARKKHRLQQELRMDYRRYMAEKNRLDTGHRRAPEGRSAKEHLVPHPPPSVPLGSRNPSQPRGGVSGPASCRDAATLTDIRRTTQGASRPIRRRTSHREGSDEEPLGRQSGDDDEDGGGGEERPVGGRRQQRHMGIQAGIGSSDAHRANGEKRENPAGGARADRRSRLLTNRDPTEFATGLLIGAVDVEEALRKRQERYRQELEEQIAERQRIRRREKEQEQAGAVTAAAQQDHIRYVGLQRRREVPVVAEPSREHPPPEPVHGAFQSPLLEYSAALGDGLLSSYGQPGPPPLHRALDMPRMAAYLPHPPPVLPDGAYRSPCHNVCHCCSTRTTLDPHHHHHHHLHPACGDQQVPVPVPSGGGGSIPASYWALPLEGSSVPQPGHHGPHSQNSGGLVPDPPLFCPAAAAARSPMRAGGGAVSVDSVAGGFPGDRARTTKEKMLSYQEALKQQILERQEQRRAEREERERDDARLEADMRNHQPWGRGGGGAPLRDSTGNLITDLHQMHKQNEEAYINPERRSRRAPVAAAVPPADPAAVHPAEPAPAPGDRVSGFAHVQTPQFARGAVFASEPSAQQLQEKDKYQGDLKEQIEEKRRQKAAEQEQSRLEEEREERRLAEQRALIQREYEEEQDRRKRKEMEQKAKNEELVRQAEDRKTEAERAKRESAELRRQYEQERHASLEEQAHTREPSPPIPTLQRGPPRYTPRPPTYDSQRSTAAMSERSLSGLQSPPVPACRNHLRTTEDQRDVFTELSALRRKLRSEHRRLEDGLLQGEWEELESPLSDRLRERPPVDVFDMARLRLPVAVRRPSSRNHGPSNLQRIHDSLQLKPSDGEFRAFSSEFPRVDDEEGGVASQRRRGYRDQRQRTAQDGDLDVPRPQQRDHQRGGTTGGSSRGSLLESDSAFIDPLGEVYPVPPTPEQRETPQLSARERRRLTRKMEPPQAASRDPLGQPGSYSSQSQSSLQEMEPVGKRTHSKARSPTCSRRDNKTSHADLPLSSSSSDGGGGGDDGGGAHHRLHHHASSDLWARP